MRFKIVAIRFDFLLSRKRTCEIHNQRENETVKQKNIINNRQPELVSGSHPVALLFAL
ncbi:hypothetical protein [Dokdonia pacifica]|uniref:hypothetical protein n=1 Tax=Dokdonia pacifica TaxID=1627892 RepID=UPI0015C58C49|nr:hypothetical protein [Dokdonia pacifica]